MKYMQQILECHDDPRELEILFQLDKLVRWLIAST